MRHGLLELVRFAVEQRNLAFVLFAVLFVSQFAQVNAVKALQKRIALHDFVVEVGQW